jgi:hypothetical protein
MFTIGATFSVYQGVSSIADPGEVHNSTFNYVILGIAAVLEAAALSLALRNMERTQTQRRVVGDQRNERSNPLHRCARRLSSTYRYRIGRRWSGLIASLRINDIRRHRRHTDRATTRRRCTDTGLRIKKPAARRISKPKDSRPNY